MDSIKDSAQIEPIRLANATLGTHRHVCAFFHSADEEYRVLLPFIQEGLQRGERAFHIVDPGLREEHLRRLEAAGIDATAANQCGQFELRDWHETYLRGGRFDPEKMLGVMRDASLQSREQGYSLIRVLAHPEWCGEDWPGADDFLEYEARLNELVPQTGDPIICLYDLAKIGGRIVMDVMRTHPLVILGGVLQENPFFVPPEEFLRELRDRKANRTATHA
ncbi:hypothetical protein AYO47_05270 [Planctomyces sp. SCGC AG-212-M04]|nr:hypothetical protein AYO47_05270 [Planctomyces sp. SCGC AG-212-M04]